MSKKPLGAPTTYDPNKIHEICELIATHSCGLKKLCRDYPDIMPADSDTIYKWCFRHEEFNFKYLEARAFQQQRMVEQINEDMNEDILHYVDSEGNNRIDSPSIALATAKANNKKWAASKLAPKRFGDKLAEISDKSSIIEQLISKI